MYVNFIQIEASTVCNSLYAALVSNVRTKIEPPGDDDEQTSPSRRTFGLCNKKAIGWPRTRCWALNTWGVVNAAIAAAAAAATVATAAGAAAVAAAVATAAALGETILD